MKFLNKLFRGWIDLGWHCPHWSGSYHTTEQSRECLMGTGQSNGGIPQFRFPSPRIVSYPAHCINCVLTDISNTNLLPIDSLFSRGF